MSSSPFEIFRRNLKPMMVFLTGLAMFAFVVLPVLDSYMRTGPAGGADEVVAEFGNTKLTRARVDSFTRNHQSTVRFLRELAERTIAEGGEPGTPGFAINRETNQIQSIGINEFPSIPFSIRTMQFAAEATQAGFALDDVAIELWLQKFTAGVFTENEIGALLMQSTRNQMALPHLYEQLRNQLLAEVYLQGAYSTLADPRFNPSPQSVIPLKTPAEQWETFLKLNLNAKVDAYELKVNDFTPDYSPSGAEIQSVFEEGKNRFPSDQSPEPGFRRPYQAKFEYLTANFKTVLDAEIAKLDEIPEEQLKKRYDERVQQGDFKVEVESSPEVEGTETEGTETEGAEGEATKPEGGTTGAESAESEGEPAEAEGTDTEATKPEGETEATETEATESEAEAESAESEAAATESESADGETTESDGASEESGESESGENERAGLPLIQATRLVAVQQEGSESDTQPPTGEEATSPAEGDAPVASEDETQPAAEEETQPPAEGENQPPAEEDAKPQESETASEAAAEAGQATEAQATEGQATEGQATEGGEEPATEESPEPAVKPFEEVREEILKEMQEELARPKALAAMQFAARMASARMDKYFKQRAIQQDDAPPKPDLEKLAKEVEQELAKSGNVVTFVVEKLKFHDIQTFIRDEPIALSRARSSQTFGFGPAFVETMYGGGPQGAQPRPLFQPEITSDLDDNQFVGWKVDEKKEMTPTLDEVRDEVIDAILLREARKLALAEAQKMAKEANESGTLTVPDDKKDLYQENLGPFTWIVFDFQRRGAVLGNVKELESVGEDFMKSVFTTKPGEFTAALNQPQNVAYVIRTVSYEPSIPALRDQFKQESERQMATFLGGNDTDEVIRGFYESIDEESGFVSNIETE